MHASRRAIENALTLIAISAYRFYWLLYTGRQTNSRAAIDVFETHEWQALYLYFQEPLPTKIPTVAEIIYRIARLGGYKHRPRDKPPGIKTLWLGFQQFTAITTLYQRTLTSSLTSLK